MQQALYRKYRPDNFLNIVGQEPIKLTLANQVRLGRVGHAYLFSGPKGTGKTTMARVLAKAVNCLQPQEGNPCGKCDLCRAADNGSMMDLIEMDAASHTGVDDVREVINGVYTAPSMAKYKVYVIDEAHMLSKSAFNALLKTLEEPPAHVIFILASTEIDKFPSTIVSRCLRFDFRPIVAGDMFEHLKTIASTESIQIDDEALGLIVQQSGGGMRDALSLLERAANMGVAVTGDNLRQWFGWLDWHQIYHLTDLTIRGEAKQALAQVAEFMESGYDPQAIARAWAGLVSDMLLSKLGVADQRSFADINKLAQLVEVVDQAEIVWWLEQMIALPYQIKNAVLPQLPLELLIVKVAERLGGVNLRSQVLDIQHDQDLKSPADSVPGNSEPVYPLGISESSARSDDALKQVHADGGEAGTGGSIESAAGLSLQEDRADAAISGVEPAAIVSEDQSQSTQAEEPVAVASASGLDWEAVIKVVRDSSPTLGAVLGAANWQLDGEKIVVSVNSNFHKEKLEQPATRDLVLGVLAGQGVNLSVEYRLDDKVREANSELDPSKVMEVFG